MRYPTLLIALFSYCLLPLEAAPTRFAEIELTDGRLLQNAKVINKTAVDVIFLHSKGVEDIAFEQLPKAIQDALGYSPEAAEAKRTELELQAKRDADARAANQARLEQTLAQRAKEKERQIKLKTDGRILTGRVTSIGSEGFLIYCRKPSNRVVTSRLGSIGGGGGSSTPKQPKYRYLREYGTFFVTGYPNKEDLADDDLLTIEALKTGNHQYRAVNGSMPTVAKYEFLQIAKPIK